jgi:hypothetical protein
MYAGAKGAHVDVLLHLWDSSIRNDKLARSSLKNPTVRLLELLSQRITYTRDDAMCSLRKGDIVIWDWFAKKYPALIRNAASYVTNIAHYDHVIDQGAQKSLSAFVHACETGNLDLCKHLIACGNPYTNAAFIAAGAHVHVMEWLLSIGVEYNCVYGNPHLKAAGAGSIVASQWLQTHIAGIDTSAWLEAASRCHVQYMKYLHSCNVPPPGTTGMYALMCKETTVDTLDWLVDECNAGFDIMWIIHLRKRSPTIMWMIRRFGSQINAKSNYNPFHTIIIRSSDAMINWIMSNAYVDVSQLMHKLAELTSRNPHKREKYDRVERAIRHATSFHTK